MTINQALEIWKHMKPGKFGVYVTFKKELPLTSKATKMTPAYDPSQCYRITTRHCIGTVPYTHLSSTKDKIAAGQQIIKSPYWDESTKEGEKGIIFYRNSGPRKGEPGLHFIPTHELDKNIYYIMGKEVSRVEIEDLYQQKILQKGALKDRAGEDEPEFIPFLATLINIEVRNKTSGNTIADPNAIKHSSEYKEGLKEVMNKYDKFPAMSDNELDMIYPEEYRESLNETEGDDTDNLKYVYEAPKLGEITKEDAAIRNMFGLPFTCDAYNGKSLISSSDNGSPQMRKVCEFGKRKDDIDAIQRAVENEEGGHTHAFTSSELSTLKNKLKDSNEYSDYLKSMNEDVYRQYEDPYELENELKALEAEYEEALMQLEPLAERIAELKERINFAWQDDEYNSIDDDYTGLER